MKDTNIRIETNDPSSRAPKENEFPTGWTPLTTGHGTNGYKYGVLEKKIPRRRVVPGVVGKCILKNKSGEISSVTLFFDIVSGGSSNVKPPVVLFCRDCDVCE